MILFIVCQSLSPREMQNWNGNHSHSGPHNKMEMTKVTLVIKILFPWGSLLWNVHLSLSLVLLVFLILYTIHVYVKTSGF